MKEKQKRSLLNSISSLVRPLWLLLVSAAATVVELSKQGKAGSRVSQPVARSSFFPSPVLAERKEDFKGVAEKHDVLQKLDSHWRLAVLL